jgi:hypothetical protein
MITCIASYQCILPFIKLQGYQNVRKFWLRKIQGTTATNWHSARPHDWHCLTSMPAHYAPLPNPRTDLNPENEMDEAFESDDPDPGEEAPIPEEQTSERSCGVSSGTAGAYDFEREYDMPPPGSPPRPSTVALPNDYGNSNGLIPTEPVSAPITSRPSLFRRVMGAMLPTHYTLLPTGETSHAGARGSGIENDGVFANVQAKPSVPRTVQMDDGEIYTIPEDVQKEPPPVRFRVYDGLTNRAYILHQRRTQTLRLMPCHLTGKLLSTPPSQDLNPGLT